MKLYHLLTSSMQLTEKQLKIQEFADKTLSFGCMIMFRKHVCKVLWTHKNQFFGDKELIDYIGFPCPLDRCSDYVVSDINEIIWHPMTYSRLLYFMTIYKDCDLLTDHIVEYVLKNPNVLNETVLERPEYLLDRVIDFLDTLPKE